MRRSLLTILLAASLATPLALSTSAAAHTMQCGSITIRFSATETDRYPVSVTQGAVTCKAARSLLTGYVKTGNYPRSWFCVRGHNTQPYAAQCARIKGPSGHVVAGLTVKR